MSMYYSMVNAGLTGMSYIPQYAQPQPPTAAAPLGSGAFMAGLGGSGVPGPQMLQATTPGLSMTSMNSMNGMTSMNSMNGLNGMSGMNGLTTQLSPQQSLVQQAGKWMMPHFTATQIQYMFRRGRLDRKAAKAVRCETCDLTLNSEQQAQQHFSGKSHAKKLKKLTSGSESSTDKAGSRSPSESPDPETSSLASSSKASDGDGDPAAADPKTTDPDNDDDDNEGKDSKHPDKDNADKDKDGDKRDKDNDKDTVDNATGKNKEDKDECENKSKKEDNNSVNSGKAVKKNTNGKDSKISSNKDDTEKTDKKESSLKLSDKNDTKETTSHDELKTDYISPNPSVLSSNPSTSSTTSSFTSSSSASTISSSSFKVNSSKVSASTTSSSLVSSPLSSASVVAKLTPLSSSSSSSFTSTSSTSVTSKYTTHTSSSPSCARTITSSSSYPFSINNSISSASLAMISRPRTVASVVPSTFAQTLTSTHQASLARAMNRAYLAPHQVQAQAQAQCNSLNSYNMYQPRLSTASHYYQSATPLGAGALGGVNGGLGGGVNGVTGGLGGLGGSVGGLTGVGSSGFPSISSLTGSMFTMLNPTASYPSSPGPSSLMGSSPSSFLTHHQSPGVAAIQGGGVSHGGAGATLRYEAMTLTEDASTAPVHAQSQVQAQAPAQKLDPVSQAVYDNVMGSMQLKLKRQATESLQSLSRDVSSASKRSKDVEGESIVERASAGGYHCTACCIYVAENQLTQHIMGYNHRCNLQSSALK